MGTAAGLGTPATRAREPIARGRVPPPALAVHVACGRLDAYFEDGFGGPWDVAAGAVIIEEAGGVLRSHLGEPFVLKGGKGQVLCGNVAVVEDIARVLRSVEP